MQGKVTSDGYRMTKNVTYDVWQQPINDNPVVRRYRSNFELKKKNKTYPLSIEEVGSKRVRCKLELLPYIVTVGNWAVFF